MMPTLSLSEYLDLLKQRYQLNYNVEINKFIQDVNVDIFALSVIEHYRNVISKKIQIDRYEERKIILVKGYESLVKDGEMNDFFRFLTRAAQELVIPSLDIMSHLIDGIIVSAQGFSQEAISAAQKYKYSRTFFLGIKGWCDIRLLLVDLKNSTVFYNVKGKEIVQVYSFTQRQEVVKNNK